MIEILVASERRLPFYLCLEEWVATHLPPDCYFFTWAVPPTVICGRNQLMEAEADLTYCRREGIDVCRRKSGGGAVYADGGNLMISVVTAQTGSVPSLFQDYSQRLAACLRALGVEAEASGRNDVLIGGAKVSGGAFSQLPARSIIHSTLLHSCDSERMGHALTPSRAKLESKQVTSVESRVTTLSRHLPSLTFADLRSHVSCFFATSSLSLTAEQIAEVEALELSTYGTLSGLASAPGGKVYDFKPKRQRELPTRSVYIPGHGTLCMGFALSAEGVIEAATLAGDLLTADLAAIEARLPGLRPEQVRDVAPGPIAEAIINELSKQYTEI